MSWGSLNNQRNRRTKEPLPDFLIESDPLKEPTSTVSFEDVTIVTRRADGPYSPRRSDADLKGYGVSYPSGLSIQMSKKSLLLSMVFFTLSVLLAFCLGFFIRETWESKVNNITTTAINAVKKPIIPNRNRQKQNIEENERIHHQESLVKESLADHKNENKKESEVLDEKDTQTSLDDNDSLN